MDWYFGKLFIGVGMVEIIIIGKIFLLKGYWVVRSCSSCSSSY